MARDAFYEVNGLRVAQSDVTQVTVRRCDGCGEFMEANEGIEGRVQVEVFGGHSITAVLDAHAGHEAQALADVQRKIADHITWPPAF